METVPQNVASLRELLGDFVPLPCNTGNGGKGAIIPKWQHLTLRDVTQAHVEQCERPEYRIGVSLGRASGSLCVLDGDSDPFAREMLRLNPALAETLTTTCNRGQSFWLRVAGAFPGNAALEWHGEKCGEWRATGNLSVVAGKDTVTGNYRRFVTRAPAMSFLFEDLRWPSGLTANGKPWPTEEREGIIDVEQDTYTPQPCSTSLTRSEKERAEKEWRLYRDLVAHLPGRGGERNALLTRAAPFLCHAVCESLAVAFLMRHFDTVGKPGGWKATRDEHRESVKLLISGYVARYAGRLPTEERTKYQQLDEAQRAAYRILRDCAKRDDRARGCPPGLFIMAFGELATRLRCSNCRATAIIIHFRDTGILGIAAPGIQRTKGVRGVATRWRWLLPLT